MRIYSVSQLNSLVNGNAVEIPLTCDGLKGGLSLRQAGDMSLTRGQANGFEIRNSFFKDIVAPGIKVIGLKQIHSKTVFVAERLMDRKERTVASGDGLVSKTGNVVLSVTVADCLPIWIFDKRNLFYGLVHSGWRGTGIVIEALDIFRSWGSLLEDLGVVIGPGIGGCCYNVDSYRYQVFKEAFGGNSVDTFHGKFYLDLREANIGLLKSYGISDISLISDCTYCNTKLSSYRREGKERFGTMVALLGRRENFL